MLLNKDFYVRAYTCSAILKKKNMDLNFRSAFMLLESWMSTDGSSSHRQPLFVIFIDILF